MDASFLVGYVMPPPDNSHSFIRQLRAVN